VPPQTRRALRRRQTAGNSDARRLQYFAIDRTDGS
jgi:hypothetical protein